MLKKFQHDSDIAKVSIFDYGLWTHLNGKKILPPWDLKNCVISKGMELRV